MKKHLLAVAVSIVALGGVTFATQILETPPTTTSVGNSVKPVVGRPNVRPSLIKLLDKRPALPVKRPMPKLGTGSSVITGSAVTGTKQEEIKQVVQTIVRQNAQDVAAYRTENGYIAAYLKKGGTFNERRVMSAAIQSAVKTLLATQKRLLETHTISVNSGTQNLSDMLAQADAAIDVYKDSLLPYIDSTKQDEFARFIIGRTNLLKILLTKIKKTDYSTVDDSSSRTDIK
ncbi:hypothetical protein KBC03_02860 [Patescibacteria group bacterium]|nr:hypothetical protein [Patescibacteria group bacterium]